MSMENIARNVFGITEKDLLPGETLQDAMERVLKKTKEMSDELERFVSGDKAEE